MLLYRRRSAVDREQCDRAVSRTYIYYNILYYLQGCYFIANQTSLGKNQNQKISKSQERTPSGDYIAVEMLSTVCAYGKICFGIPRFSHFEYRSAHDKIITQYMLHYTFIGRV